MLSKNGCAYCCAGTKEGGCFTRDPTAVNLNDFAKSDCYLPRLPKNKEYTEFLTCDESKMALIAAAAVVVVLVLVVLWCICKKKGKKAKTEESAFGNELVPT